VLWGQNTKPNILEGLWVDFQFFRGLNENRAANVRTNVRSLCHFISRDIIIIILIIKRNHK
jgi:hypothetical protein